MIAVGAELVRRLGRARRRGSRREVDPVAGRSSVFVGQVHAGEIYNQDPPICWLEGTRRWLPGTDRREVEAEFRAMLDDLAAETGTTIEADFQLVRDAFALDLDAPFVADFQAAYEAISAARCRPARSRSWTTATASGPWPASRRSPTARGAGGQHTVEEWASIDDLVRVARLYALTAALFCPRG